MYKGKITVFLYFIVFYAKFSYKGRGRQTKSIISLHSSVDENNGSLLIYT